MQDKSFYINQAKDSLKQVEELLSLTYKLTKDERLFLSIMIKLYDSVNNSLNAYLNLKKEVDFEEKIKLIKEKKDSKLGLNSTDFEFLSNLNKIYVEHQKSSVEFSRKEKFIISSDDYNLHTLTFENLNEYFNDVKSVVAKFIMAS